MIASLSQSDHMGQVLCSTNALSCSSSRIIAVAIVVPERQTINRLVLLQVIHRFGAAASPDDVSAIESVDGRHKTWLLPRLLEKRAKEKKDIVLLGSQALEPVSLDILSGENIP
jgi:hypothetical protein